MKQKQIIVLVISVLLGANFVTAANFALDGIAVVGGERSVAPGGTITLNITFRSDTGCNSSACSENPSLAYNIWDGDTKILTGTTPTLSWTNTSNLTSFTVSSGAFNSIWDNELPLLGYKCGSHKIKIKIGTATKETGSIKLFKDDSDDNKFDSVIISPENPTSDGITKITVKDASGDNLEDATVLITQFGDNGEWDDDDEKIDGNTDRHGVLEFTISKKSAFKSKPYGKYQADVYDRGYCLSTKTFTVANPLTLLIVTKDLYAGETIQVRVTDQNGNGVQGASVSVFDKTTNPTSKFGAYTTYSSGYAEFTPKNSGTYGLSVIKTDYQDVARDITVNERKGTTISASADPLVGSPITLTVKSNSAALEGAEVTLIDPNGASIILSAKTSSTGEVSYTPAIVGAYKATAKKAGYADAPQITFDVMRKFDIVPPAGISAGSAIEIIVKDSSGALVQGVSVYVKEKSTISGITDSLGKVTLTIPEPGTYTLSIKKAEFSDKEVVITVTGNLLVAVVPEVVGINENSTITVKDQKGAAIDANIAVTKGEFTSSGTSSSYTFSAQDEGDYEVMVTKQGYATVKKHLTVKPYPLVIEFSGSLDVSATSGGSPVANVSVTIVSATGMSQTQQTGENGVARFAVVDGTYKVTVSKANYETKALEAEAKSGGLLPWIIPGIIAVAILAVLIYFAHHMGRKKGKKESNISPPSGGRSVLGSK